MINAAIFISGKGSNMEKIIQESQKGILKNIINIKLVFSDNSKSEGLKKAESHKIKTIYLKQYYKNREKGEKKLIKILKKEKIQFIILAGYMRILSPLFINEFKNRIINIHPADTEKYRGKYGYKWAFENNLKESFITVHLVNEIVDGGKILKKEKFKIPPESTLSEIKKIGQKKEHEVYSQAIREYILNEFK